MTPLIVSGVKWRDEDAEVFERALRGLESALGDNDAGKQVVGRHLHRIVKGAGASNEVYFWTDLYDLLRVLKELEDLLLPQTEVAWWREQGAPGADDAVAGLARERSESVRRLSEAKGLVMEALATVELASDPDVVRPDREHVEAVAS